MITADLATIIDRLEVEFVKLPYRVLNCQLQLVFNSFSHSSLCDCISVYIHPPFIYTYIYPSNVYYTVDPNSLLLYSVLNHFCRSHSAADRNIYLSTIFHLLPFVQRPLRLLSITLSDFFSSTYSNSYFIFLTFMATIPNLFFVIISKRIEFIIFVPYLYLTLHFHTQEAWDKMVS